MSYVQNAVLGKTFITGLFITLACGRTLADTVAAAPAPISFATLQVISNDDSTAVIAEKAAKVLPRPNQTDWMRLERALLPPLRREYI